MKVYLVYEICDDFEEQTTCSYLREICSSPESAREVCEQLAAQLGIDASEDRFEIEEWSVH